MKEIPPEKSQREYNQFVKEKRKKAAVTTFIVAGIMLLMIIGLLIIFGRVL